MFKKSFHFLLEPKQQTSINLIQATLSFVMSGETGIIETNYESFLII